MSTTPKPTSGGFLQRPPHLRLDGLMALHRRVPDCTCMEAPTAMVRKLISCALVDVERLLVMREPFGT